MATLMATLWRIVKLNAHADSGAVYEAHWEALDYEEVEGNTHNGRMYGKVKLESDVTSENFIPWIEVTEVIAIEWVKANLGQEKVTELEAKISSMINNSKTVTVEKKLPWVEVAKAAANLAKQEDEAADTAADLLVQAALRQEDEAADTAADLLVQAAPRKGGD